jgi:serine protease Do
VVAKAKPFVVTINIQVTTLDFFNQPQTQQGAGSGWIIDGSGLVVTNNHVVQGAENVTVTLDDGRTFPVDMSIIATDFLADLAVLRIEADNLTAAAVGDSSQMRVGDWVVALGNSLGEGVRATQGIVSRKDFSITVDEGQTLYGLIETTAAINPGNSGGPLVSMAGEVIGINTVKTVQAEVELVGWAISSNEALPIIQQLINAGYVVRPWLGVGLFTVNEFLVFNYNLTVEQGAFLMNVASGSPADRAGLREGDVITRYEDQEIAMLDDLIMAIHTSEIGQTIEITFWRGDNERTTQAILTESPPPGQ